MFLLNNNTVIPFRTTELKGIHLQTVKEVQENIRIRYLSAMANVKNVKGVQK